MLLPIIRNISSNMLLGRAKPKIQTFLSESQSAYKKYRSTSDIIWIYRWVIARVQVYQEKIYITEIDRGSVFDTIKRGKLLEILSSFLSNDEIRIHVILKMELVYKKLVLRWPKFQETLVQFLRSTKKLFKVKSMDIIRPEQKLRTHARKLVTLSPASSLQENSKFDNT